MEKGFKGSRSLGFIVQLELYTRSFIQKGENGNCVVYFRLQRQEVDLVLPLASCLAHDDKIQGLLKRLVGRESEFVNEIVRGVLQLFLYGPDRKAAGD